MLGTQLEEALELAIEHDKQYALILYNDDVNTFDHVINCLVKYCGHQTSQAEQCANIVHFKGKCQVNNGALKDMQQQCTALLEEKLSAKIEDRN
ncbi:MAG: ATP-dependent Clp protease adaptor ClpS [Bacteroidetes bacterium]|nr:ATP-dependent Clp protease adaptor ClpS [Bacteroidota bacterium]